MKKGVNMSFNFEKFAQGVVNSMQSQYNHVEQNIRKDVRSKVSEYTDDQLEYLLNKNRDEGRYVVVEEIERELERRGRY